MAEIQNSFSSIMVAHEIINIMAKYNLQIDALDLIVKCVRDEIMKQKICHVDIKESSTTP